MATFEALMDYARSTKVDRIDSPLDGGTELVLKSDRGSIILFTFGPWPLLHIAGLVSMLHRPTEVNLVTDTYTLRVDDLDESNEVRQRYNGSFRDAFLAGDPRVCEALVVYQSKPGAVAAAANIPYVNTDGAIAFEDSFDMQDSTGPVPEAMARMFQPVPDFGPDLDDEEVAASVVGKVLADITSKWKATQQMPLLIGIGKDVDSIYSDRLVLYLETNDIFHNAGGL